MIYRFLPRPIQPVTVLELPYSVADFEDVVRHLNSNEAVCEARGTIEASFHRQRETIDSVLHLRTCLGVFPVLGLLEDGAPSHLELRIPCDAAYIQGSSFAAIAVATVGDLVDAECSRLYKRGEYFDALVVDAMASAALEKAIEQVREEIREAESEMKLGQSLFPGTQQMPIEVLRAIFSLLRPDERIDVRLTEDMIMIPIRSTSVVIPGVFFAKTLNWS